MKNNLLNEVTILDFSYRLPGPFATKVLSDLGAHVIKCESPPPYDDPFSQNEIEKIAPNFLDWYKNLNAGKEIMEIDQSTKAAELQKLIDSAQVLIIPASKHFDSFEKRFKLEEKIVIELAAGRGAQKSLHDLNVLALSRSFNHHAEISDTPPYLPFGGIAFAQYVSTYLLAALLGKKYGTHTLYMAEIVPELFNLLDYGNFKAGEQVLHTGRYPAYGIYRTKDNKVLTLAAIEEKFWMRLIDSFSLPLELSDRFDTTSRVRSILEKRFSKLTSNEIQETINNQDICLTIS